MKRWLFLPILVGAALAQSCSGPDTGSETHWMSCDTTDDCPLEASCVQGQCTAEPSYDAGGNANNQASDMGIPNNGVNNGNNENNNNPGNNGVDAGTGADLGPTVDMGGPDFGGPDPGPDAGDMGLPPDIEFLNDDITFLNLPIGSDRAAVSGYDPTTDLCISVIWTFGSADQRPPGGFCDHDPMAMRPYVYLEQGAEAGCWDYGGNGDVVSVSGCADFEGYGAGHSDLADDIRVEIASDLFDGVVRFHNVP